MEPANPPRADHLGRACAWRRILRRSCKLGLLFKQSFWSGVLAITVTVTNGSQMIEADVVFNNNNLGGSGNFTSGQTVAPQRDFHRVALHEFGHVLGLDHPDQATPPQSVSAVMNSVVSNLETLQPDDIAGVKVLYDQGSAGATPSIAAQPQSRTVQVGD